MAQVNPSVVRAQIAAAATAPVCVLIGEDEVEKSALAAEFAAMVDEELHAFNVERLYGGDTKVDRLIDSARTFPMMVPRRIIIVMEAEKLLTPKRETKAGEEEQERLEEFLKTPPAHTTIVLVCGALDMRRRIPRMLAKEAQVVNCGTIENEADAERWVTARAARDGVKLEPAAIRALVARAGLDLVRLRAGLERVALYAMGQASISADDVRQSVPAGPEAQADWGIANAIGRGDAREALNELGLALDAGAPPYFALGQIRLAAEKLPPSRVAAGIEALMRTDVALKSSGGDPRALLERLVVELSGSPGRGRSSEARPQTSKHGVPR